MLVLGRKENETILIGDNIRVTIVGRSGSSIRVGVQAPRDIRVVRQEIAETDFVGTEYETAEIAGEIRESSKSPSMRLLQADSNRKVG